jgi:hypothetical protein
MKKEILIFILLSSSYSISQTYNRTESPNDSLPGIKKDAFIVDALATLGFGIYYEREVSEALLIRFGFNSFKVSGSSIPIFITGLIGNRHSFEIGFGGGIHFGDRIPSPGGPTSDDRTYIMLAISLGYRYTSDWGFIFRTGIEFPANYNIFLLHIGFGIRL